MTMWDFLDKQPWWGMAYLILIGVFCCLAMSIIVHGWQERAKAKFWESVEFTRAEEEDDEKETANGSG